MKCSAAWCMSVEEAWLNSINPIRAAVKERRRKMFCNNEMKWNEIKETKDDYIDIWLSLKTALHSSPTRRSTTMTLLSYFHSLHFFLLFNLLWEKINCVKRQHKEDEDCWMNEWMDEICSWQLKRVLMEQISEGNLKLSLWLKPLIHLEKVHNT